MKRSVLARSAWLVALVGCLGLSGCLMGSDAPTASDPLPASAPAELTTSRPGELLTAVNSSIALPLDPLPTSAGAELTASRPGELLAAVKSLLAQRARAGYGVGGGVGIDTLELSVQSLTSDAAGNQNVATTAVRASGTTIQEAGVDEDDLLKTDGSMIYSIAYRHDSGTYARRTSLQAHQRAQDGSANKTATLEFPEGNAVVGMYLAPAAKRIAVLGSEWQSTLLVNQTLADDSRFMAWPLRYRSFSKVTMTVVSTATPNSLPALTTVAIDGSMVGSRLIGNILYLTTTWSPYLAVDALPYGATAAERDDALAAIKIEDVLPTIQVDAGSAMPLLADTDCHVQSRNASLNLQVTTVTAIDLASPTLKRNSRCFLGGSEAIYVSERSVYLATTRYAYDNDGRTTWSYPPDITTDIHKFSIDGLAVRYRASGEVKGHLGWQQDKKAYRLSEYKGDLRVITFTGATGWGAQPTGAASPATLTILREQADSLAGTRLGAIATLPNSARTAPLGLAGEQVYAVRFAADRGYVVTFRQIDPLYVLDLSDPFDPKTVGELKVPGFSDYLYPLGRNLLLGVGKDANESGRVQGVKLGLIDVSDMQNPKELATRIVGKSWSASALDYSSHGISLFADGNVMRIALPVLVRDEGSRPVLQALHRFEVNTEARTLVDKPYVLGTLFAANDPWALGLSFDIASERSVHMGPQLYYLTGGEIRASNW